MKLYEGNTLTEDVGKNNRNALIDYIENMDNSNLRNLVLDISGYSGVLEEYDWWANDEEFFSIHFPNSYDAVRAIQYGNYDFNDDYVKFNGYGGIESSSEYDVVRELRDNADEIADGCIEIYEGGAGDYLPDDIVDILESNVLEIEDDEYDLIDD